MSSHTRQLSLEHLPPARGDGGVLLTLRPFLGYLILGGLVSRDSNLSLQSVDQHPYRCTNKTPVKEWSEVIFDLTIHMRFLLKTCREVTLVFDHNTQEETT